MATLNTTSPNSSQKSNAPSRIAPPLAWPAATTHNINDSNARSATGVNESAKQQPKPPMQRDFAASKLAAHKGSRSVHEPLVTTQPQAVSDASVAAKAPSLSKPPKPFRSSLIDTVRVVLDVPHKPLAQYAENNPNVRLDGIRLYVRSPFTGAIAQVFSASSREKLIIEFSIPKFLTGQNIVGSETVHERCLECIKLVRNIMQLKIIEATRKRIEQGGYRLTRVDSVAHIDCGSAQRATETMAALRTLIASKAKDVAFYDLNTIYVGQHSRRRTLKIYRKDIEIGEHPMPVNVYGRSRLLSAVNGVIRVEFTMRRDELSDHQLDNPLAWNTLVLRLQLDRWFQRLQLAPGFLPDHDSAACLSPALATRFNAWLIGDPGAFTRGVTADTVTRYRREVHSATGVDIASPFTAEQQADAVKTIREVIGNGLGYRTHDHMWRKLTNAVRKNPLK